MKYFSPNKDMSKVMNVFEKDAIHLSKKQKEVYEIALQEGNNIKESWNFLKDINYFFNDSIPQYIISRANLELYGILNKGRISDQYFHSIINNVYSSNNKKLLSYMGFFDDAQINTIHTKPLIIPFYDRFYNDFCNTYLLFSVDEKERFLIHKDSPFEETRKIFYFFSETFCERRLKLIDSFVESIFENDKKLTEKGIVSIGNNYFKLPLLLTKDHKVHNWLNIGLPKNIIKNTVDASSIAISIVNAYFEGLVLSQQKDRLEQIIQDKEKRKMFFLQFLLKNENIKQYEQEDIDFLSYYFKKYCSALNKNSLYEIIYLNSENIVPVATSSFNIILRSLTLNDLYEVRNAVYVNVLDEFNIKKNLNQIINEKRKGIENNG